MKVREMDPRSVFFGACWTCLLVALLAGVLVDREHRLRLDALEDRAPALCVHPVPATCDELGQDETPAEPRPGRCSVGLDSLEGGR